MSNLSTLTASLVLLVSLGLVHAQEGQKRSIPPDAEAATSALTSSPRHGEMIDIAVPGADAKLRTFVAYPERKDDAPVVIVIHEIFGLTEWVRAVADQPAAEGFIAVAPDLLSGEGPGGGGTESFAGDQVRDAVRKLTPEKVEQRLNAVREHALQMPSAGDKSATIGFCWGGTQSITYATRQPQLNAAVIYYGTAPKENDALAKVKAPVIGFYGGDDHRVTSTVEATEAAMKELNRPFTAHVYEGAGHGFLRQQAGQDGANRKAAEAAWKETISFLKQHLK
jgi:carboxymethylenebutenolidase